MNNAAALDWDNLKVFLATMRGLSLRQAARDLKISHPTARRRLERLEEDLGYRLFERRGDGLHPTAEATTLLPLAEDVEGSVLGFERVARAADSDLHGELRLTLPNLLATDLLMPDLVQFNQRWPQIRLQIDISYELARLDRREADVALRFMPPGQLPKGDLIGRRVASVHRAVYGEGDVWIGWGREEDDALWIKNTPYPKLKSVGALNDAMLQRAACLAGLGLTFLPCFFAEPLLKRRSEPVLGFDVWLLIHPDLKRSPKIRVFRESIIAALKAHKPRLEGASI